MTFAIAKIIDPDAGKVTLLSDTKLTDSHDDTHNRQSLRNPCQKVVIVDDDLVVSFAGDNPESAVKRVVELRGRSAKDIEEALLSYTAEMNAISGVSKSFLVVARKPTPRITVISNGALEDRTEIGTGWIGDRDAFDAYSAVFQDSAELDNLHQRFIFAMTFLTSFEDVETVGGYLVRVTGRSDRPFRFQPDVGIAMPDGVDATMIETPPDRPTKLTMSLVEGADPTYHVRLQLPGTGPTYSALGHYIPEARSAWLHTHEEPWRAAMTVNVGSVSELVEVARTNHGQHLDPVGAQYYLDGNSPAPNAAYFRPYPKKRI